MAFVPTTRSEVEAWLLRFHASNDSLDVNKLPNIYAKNAEVQFGNMPILVGHDALRNFFSAIWPKLETMHHAIESYDMIEDRIYSPCRITWAIKDDPEKEIVSVPAFAAIHLVTSGEEKGLIRRAAFYMDGAPLAAALQRSS
ncbi:hypothetical protein GGS23DRAFT_222630 [Durotheca rogersii]|uniref:uncharacterized protein n=1 Tax=Durotheca rogersii TaxID=419775 RepID=UPI00221EA354|nr:uncharacterized protein GGS23DRAFT_222630 [Durotheca rogersii]KAI5860720.1 hypothetical protein GGS23DRAFT_222630 [Durotheca rogersii]